MLQNQIQYNQIRNLMQDLLTGRYKDHHKIKIKGCKRQSFLDQAILNGDQLIFYLIRCWANKQLFYKLGITVKNILTRYGTVRAMPYEWEILLPEKQKQLYDL
jgi:hypothetical protein